MEHAAHYGIVSIFTNQLAYEVAKKVSEEQGYPYPVYFTPLENAINFAKEMIQSGAETIISRGGVATVLQQNVDVPVISIKYSFSDFAISIEKARKISNKIAIVSYGTGIAYAQRILPFFDAKITMAQVKNAADMEETLRELQKSGIEVIIGGHSSTTAAQKLGMHTVYMSANRYDFIEAVENAQKNLAMYYEQKSRLQTITAVLNSATTAMLVIDNHGQITNMNGKAQDVLGVTEENAVGKPYRKVFPDSRIVEETLRGHEVREKIIQYNMNYLVVSSNPILLDGNIIGAVLNIQVGKEIQSIENKLRIKTVSSGYVARSEFSDILGTSAAICTIKERASVYAQVDSTIMLYGESGVGKELFAQSIHNDSKRRNYPFVAVNCAALPESLLESELFGYEKGAFTGARAEGKEGIFEMAHRGTIFLDEIGEMPLTLQSRLLRVLQEKEVTRIGGSRVLPIDVRILAATNRDLHEEVKKGNFRNDLYYRLCVLVLTIPPLRRRKEDIQSLATAFAERFSRKYEREFRGFCEDGIDALCQLNFPGNVRELSNLVERMVILSRNGMLGRDVLEEALSEEFAYEPITQAAARQDSDELERQRILRILNECGGQKEEAARLLGMSRTTLWRKLKRFQLTEC